MRSRNAHAGAVDVKQALQPQVQGLPPGLVRLPERLALVLLPANGLQCLHVVPEPLQLHGAQARLLHHVRVLLGALQELHDGAKDAFRTGSYSLLIYAGNNVSLEFLYSGPHSLLYRMHLNNAHGSPDIGPNK